MKETEQMAMMALKLDLGSIWPSFSRLMLAMGFEGSEAELELVGTAGKVCILEDARPGEKRRDMLVQ